MSFFFNFDTSLNIFEFMTKSEFLEKAHRLTKEMESLIDDYGNREEVISIMVTGCVERTDDDNKYMKAVYGLNIWSEEELAEVLDFVVDVYMGEENNNMFGFDISLN